MVKKVSENEFKSEVASGVAVVDFSATWCGPCKMLAPVLEEISEDFAGKVNFLNVDVDDNPSVAEEYGITNIPAIAVIKDGELKDMSVGFKPKEMLAEFIQKNM